MTACFESVLILKDAHLLGFLQENDEWEKELIQKLLQGKHLEIIVAFNSTSLDYNKMFKENVDDVTVDFFDLIRNAGLSFLANQDTALTLKNKMFRLFLLGITYLELYCQCNYTGPELSNVEHVKYELSNNKNIINELECDGYYPYHSVEMPQFLLAARAILSLLAAPYQKHWKEGIHLDEDGKILIPSFPKEDLPTEQQELFALFQQEYHSFTWWHARACTFHVRLLQKQNYDAIPRLWTEVVQSTTSTLVYYGGMSASITDLLKCDVTELCLASTLKRLFPSNQEGGLLIEQRQRYAMMLQGTIWLEWGLSCNHFVYGDRVRNTFKCAYIIMF